ncbi:MAG: hypothetical protein F4218_04395, partial [Synechococcus sp. SB0677_bin_5]|nr:hypothetical protein [Synechococcus sp. SB0677_bin_5]
MPCSAVWLPCQARWAGATCSLRAPGQERGKLSRGQMLPILVLFPLSAYKDCKQCWHQVLSHEYRA